MVDCTNEVGSVMETKMCVHSHGVIQLSFNFSVVFFKWHTIDVSIVRFQPLLLGLFQVWCVPKVSKYQNWKIDCVSFERNDSKTKNELDNSHENVFVDHYAAVTNFWLYFWNFSRLTGVQNLCPPLSSFSASCSFYSLTWWSACSLELKLRLFACLTKDDLIQINYNDKVRSRRWMESLFVTVAWKVKVSSSQVSWQP